MTVCVRDHSEKDLFVLCALSPLDVCLFVSLTILNYPKSHTIILSAAITVCCVCEKCNMCFFSKIKTLVYAKKGYTAMCEKKKVSDEDGIRTHACRAQWISSPSP